MEPIELTELIELRKNILTKYWVLSIELTELIKLRKNILIKYGAYRAYRAYRAKKEYAY